MIVWQSCGHFSRPKERFIVRHYRYFFTISQLKPGKRYFGKKWQRHLLLFFKDRAESGGSFCDHTHFHLRMHKFQATAKAA